MHGVIRFFPFNVTCTEGLCKVHVVFLSTMQFYFKVWDIKGPGFSPDEITFILCCGQVVNSFAMQNAKILLEYNDW